MNANHAKLISGQLAHYAATLRYDDLPNDIVNLRIGCWPTPWAAR